MRVISHLVKNVQAQKPTDANPTLFVCHVDGMQANCCGQKAIDDIVQIRARVMILGLRVRFAGNEDRIFGG